jgi:hypothetical protein
MKRTRRIRWASLVLAGAAAGTVACGPPREEPAPGVAVESASLRVEGMT